MKKLLSIFALVLCAITLPLGLVGCKKANNELYVGKWVIDKYTAVDAKTGKDTTNDEGVKRDWDAINRRIGNGYVILNKDSTYETNLVELIAGGDGDIVSLKYNNTTYAIIKGNLVWGGYCTIEMSDGSTEHTTLNSLFAEFGREQGGWYAKNNVVSVVASWDNTIMTIYLKKA